MTGFISKRLMAKHPMHGTEKVKKSMKGVREAKRWGWRVINAREVKKPTSWKQLQTWLESNCKGGYKESFYLQEIAFERDQDASWFVLKWI